MTRAETKEKTLRTLRIILAVQLLGTFGTAAATIGFIVANSIHWFCSPEDWWSGLAYCSLLMEVAAIYIFMAVCFIDDPGWEIPFPKWLEGTFFVIYFGGLFFPVPLFLTFALLQPKSPPLGYCLAAPITFILSIACCASACETGLDIRKKLDPSFKVCRGFS